MGAGRSGVDAASRRHLPTVSLGVVLPFWRDRPASEAMEIALLADRLGYGELWIGEMLHFDAFALAGAIAVRTRRITLSVGPLALGLRDPVSLAMGVSSVAVLGGRPARLALGSSSRVVVEAWHGRPFRVDPDGLAAKVAQIRRVMSGERTPTGFRSGLGSQPSHLTVAALGPRMQEAAASVGDRIVLNLVTAEQALAAAGIGLPVAVWLVVALAPGRGSRRQLTRQLALYLAADGYRDRFREAGFSRLVESALKHPPLEDLASLIPDELLQSVCAYGDEAVVRRRVDEYRATGAEVALVPVTAEDPGAVRVLHTFAGA